MHNFIQRIISLCNTHRKYTCVHYILRSFCTVSTARDLCCALFFFNFKMIRSSYSRSSFLNQLKLIALNYIFFYLKKKIEQTFCDFTSDQGHLKLFFRTCTSVLHLEEHQMSYKPISQYSFTQVVKKILVLSEGGRSRIKKRMYKKRFLHTVFGLTYFKAAPTGT